MKSLATLHAELAVLRAERKKLINARWQAERKKSVQRAVKKAELRDRDLIMIQDVAAWLNISRGTVTRMVEAGEFPAILLKSGRRKKIWRFRVGDIEEWLAKRRTATKRDLNVMAEIRKVGKIAWINDKKKKLSFVRRMVNEKK